MASKKKAATKKAAKKAVAKKAATKKTATKKTAKKTVAKKAAAKKAPVKKAAPKKPATKKTVAKKTPAAKKAATRKKTSAPAATPEGIVTHTVVEGIEPYKLIDGEEYMNENQLEHFREILLAWKRELMEEVDRTVHHMQDEAANFPDPNDRATQESEFSLELRARDRERKLIKKIDESLLKIDEDEYGWCNTCGVEIGVRRLEARPTATQCIDCKTLDEIRERQLGK